MLRLVLGAILIGLSGCATLQNHSKYELADGMYKIKVNGQRFDAYIRNTNDSIVLYQPHTKISNPLPPLSTTKLINNQQLIKYSLDIDVMTSVFKIRPKTTDLPTQMNSNLNGNLYLGYRKDIYHIKYVENPVFDFQRQVNHIGFSGGVFLGVGNTAMNASTANGLAYDYDGIVLQKGISGIFAINKLTIGLSIGTDHLLDKNRTIWQYQNKPWYGLMLGLNLN
ncbi:hypothetical protein [Runella limosa]|uniref:hypothetical protein n=1 Tax=Runella limosa TaxID=370978 RepID=UPI000490CA53|nr:hypothetical protein [Runella limosa]